MSFVDGPRKTRRPRSSGCWRRRAASVPIRRRARARCWRWALAGPWVVAQASEYGGAGAAGPTGAVGVSPAATLTKLLVLGAGVLGLGAAGVVGLSRTRDGATHSHPPLIAQVSRHGAPRSTPAVPAVESPAPEDAPAIASARSRGPNRPGARDPRATEPKVAGAGAVAHRRGRGARSGARGLGGARHVGSAARSRCVRRSFRWRQARRGRSRVARAGAAGTRPFAGAGAVAGVFSKAHPRSPYVARLRALVTAEEKAEEEKVIGAGAGGQ